MRFAPLALLALGCTPGTGADDGVPRLADVTAGDDEIALVSRSEALSGALDYDVAPAGAALDFDAAPAGFTLEADGSEVGDAADEVPTSGFEYGNYTAGVLTAAAADLITVALLLPPAAAIAITADGTVTEALPNVWVAHNTVQLGTTTVDGTFTVAWVGVGWLAEMRIASSDGQYAGDVWFNGFLSEDGRVGWWDFYDHGQLAAVVEWIGDGEGNGEFAVVGTLGEQAGSAIAYTRFDGVARIDFTSAPDDRSGFVQIADDHHGEVSHPDHASGARSCWGTDLRDVTCPE